MSSCNCPKPPTPPTPPIPPFIPGHYGYPMTPIYVDASMTIPGAAAEASTLGKILQEKSDLEMFSGLSVNITDGKVELNGFMDAELGQVPSKTEKGFEWINVEGGSSSCAINSISVNEVQVLPDDNKNVDITIPTKTSDLENDGDGTSIFVTQTNLENKQDRLISGANIKTINGENLLGSGNINITGGQPGPQGPQGPQGEQGIPGNDGQDGVSPEIVIQDITGGHRVTIKDKDHPEGQSFDVMDGQGGPSSPVDWSDIQNKPTNLATTEDIASKIFIATYNVTTAQEILNYIAQSNEPNAPIIVKRGNDYYTSIIVAKRDDNSVYVRTFGSLSGDYYIFNYIITNNTWASSSYGLQQKLVSQPPSGDGEYTLKCIVSDGSPEYVWSLV